MQVLHLHSVNYFIVREVQQIEQTINKYGALKSKLQIALHKIQWNF